MANGNYASLERQFEELRDRLEEFERRTAQQSENRNAEVGALREAMSGSISAADRDAAAVTNLAARLSTAEDRINRPPAPVNWAAIVGLVVASAGAVASLGNWALAAVKEQAGQDRQALHELADRIETLQGTATRAITLQERNTHDLLDARSRLQAVESHLSQTAERVRQTEGRVGDIDSYGLRRK